MVNKLLENSKFVQRIAVPVVVLLFVVILGCRYDFFYALNDDTGIRDLLSGNYIGKPEAHCMQILYPLALIYTCFYNMIPQIPWFGISMLIIQLLVIVGIAKLIIGRLQIDKLEMPDREKNRRYMLTSMLVITILVIISLKEMIFLQYTVVSALMSIYVIADILLSETNKEKLFLDGILFLLALSLREEMGLLMIPFIGLAAFIKCNLSMKCLFSKKWISFVLALLVGIIILFSIDAMAYAGKWRDFREFFNARTEVYDYTGIPDYEEHLDFYEENNISYNQYELLKQYNFALDESIDTEMLKKIAVYSKTQNKGSLSRRIYLAAYTCVYDFMHGWEWGFYLLLLTGYLFLYRLAINRKSMLLAVKTSLVLVLRMAIWTYIYGLGRQGGLADRITHPLFFVELLMIISLFITDNNHQRWKFSTTFCIIGMYACMLMLFSVGQIKTVDAEYETRTKTNKLWEQFRDDVGKAQGYYYIDVYSTVNYSERIFSKNQEKLRNYEIAGGWISKSPASYEKAQLFGFNTPTEGIKTGRAHFINDVEELVDFLPDKVN